ncbi:MAG: hypothetical protein CL524_15175 [Aequorivita sp.]|nr:hypothetical protein [Aequorivita sp.]
MTFPSLVPSVRSFTPGNIPQTNQTSLNGIVTGFRRGNRRTQQTLSLSFTNLNETQVNLIKSHYIDRQGTFDIFQLPSEVWSGYTTPPIPLLSDYAWRYSAAPSISDGVVGRWGIEVQLVSYAIDTGDLLFDAGTASATPARTYTLNAGSASATPARAYIINPIAAL